MGENNQMLELMSRMMDELKGLREENALIKAEITEIKEKGKRKGAQKKKVTEMRRTQPIKSSETFDELLKSLKPRNRLFVLIGVAASLRISDVLPLKMKDIQKNGDTLEVREIKTGKWKVANFDVWNDEIWDLIHTLGYTERDQYLFESNKKDENGNPKPISRQQASNILVDASFKLGLRWRDEDGKLAGTRINTHSLRKTFAYWFYKENPGKLAYLMSVLNHSKETTTLRYIGITEEEISEYARKAMIGLRKK